jgi:nicotinate-nucleotide pyrophosphorylase (carboxylating)
MMNILQAKDIIRQELTADLGMAGDVTSQLLFSMATPVVGQLVARQPGVIAGLMPAISAFALLDEQSQVECLVVDGQPVTAGQPLATVRGDARVLLAAERTVLNVIGRLSGIATATQQLVASIAHTKTKIAATRKTTPGLRGLEKYAVALGGGLTHRYGLYDAVMIKDNHRLLIDNLEDAVKRLRQQVSHTLKIQIEVDDLTQLAQALQARADLILLDNMDVPQLREAVAMTAKKAVLEASGGITPQNIIEMAETGVDIISMGWLTHSVANFDVAFDLVT